MSFAVYLSEEARQDLQRLEDFLVERALEHEDGLETVDRGMAEIRSQMRILTINPLTCRMPDGDPYERELVIPYGGSGYLALFRIVSENAVLVTAIRHQREDDYG